MTEENAAAQATPAAPQTPPANNQTPPAASTPPAANTSPETPQFKIPDAYKDKPWASKFKSEEDLYKSLENANELIGKKRIVPDFEKAKPEEIEDYYKELRPKDKAAYKFDDTKTTPELKAGFTELFYKNGISAHQANAIIKEYTAMEDGFKAKLYDKDSFMAEAEKARGSEYKAQLAKARDIAKSVLPPEIFANVDKLPNDAYFRVTEITEALYSKFDTKVKELQKQYGAKETGIGGTETPALSGSGDIQKGIDATRKELNQLQFRAHTSAEKQALTDKLTNLIVQKRGNK